MPENSDRRLWCRSPGGSNLDCTGGCRGETGFGGARGKGLCEGWEVMQELLFAAFLEQNQDVIVACDWRTCSCEP